MNNKSAKPSWVKWLWWTYFSIIGILVIMFFMISMGWMGFMPSFEELENPKTNLATEIYADDGSLLGKYFIENRSNVPYQELSPNLVNALLATEDARFYKHSGVDSRAIMRVTLGVLTFSKKGGGSTLTQQLAKNLFPRDPKANVFKLIFSKFKEWVVATKLERNYTKEEIIAMYFNTVDFGSLAHGIKSASKTFFDKEPKELNIEESAMLVGLLKAPSAYSPIRNPENALRRRNVVLHQMYKYDYITKEQFESIKAKPIDVSKYKIQDHTAGLATYFREFLRGELIKWCDAHVKPDGTKYNLYTDGLKVYTTINFKMQKYAEESVKEYLGGDLQKQFFSHWKGIRNAPFYNLSQLEVDELMMRAIKQTPRFSALKASGMSDMQIKNEFMKPVKMRVFTYRGEKDTLMSPYDSIKYYKSFLQCGMMAVDPKNGQVKAYVGGINYKHFQFDHVVLSRRQVGSTFKPFVYTLAMQEGEFSPCSMVPNVPVSFEMGDGTTWTPSNSGDARDGEMVTLRWALANSVNYVSAYLMKRYSPQAVITLCRKMGITGEIPAVPSICLGTPELTLIEMVGAFATYANQGVFNQPSFLLKICDNKGNVIETFSTQKPQEVIDQQTAFLMIKLMQGVVEGGTASRLRYKYELKMPIAGKTGTTQNNSDGWFMGLTPQLAGGVWVGCEDRAAHFRTTAQGQGANTALPVWALFIKKCYKDKSLKLDEKATFTAPQKPITVETDCAGSVENPKDNIFDK
ncbi:MAG: transglycosylase domain-containing protein [Bacteroidota bacterium]